MVVWKSSTHRGHEIIPWSAASHKDPIIDTIIRESAINVSFISWNFQKIWLFSVNLQIQRNRQSTEKFIWVENSKNTGIQPKNMRSFIIALLLQNAASHSKYQPFYQSSRKDEKLVILNYHLRKL